MWYFMNKEYMQIVPSMTVVSLFLRVKNEECFLQNVSKEPTHITSVSLSKITVYIQKINVDGRYEH